MPAKSQLAKPSPVHDRHLRNPLISSGEFQLAQLSDRQPSPSCFLMRVATDLTGRKVGARPRRFQLALRPKPPSSQWQIVICSCQDHQHLPAAGAPTPAAFMSQTSSELRGCRTTATLRHDGYGSCWRTSTTSAALSVVSAVK
jgi:hypothetical protein